jgi:hypothetical protein
VADAPQPTAATMHLFRNCRDCRKRTIFEECKHLCYQRQKGFKFRVKRDEAVGLPKIPETKENEGGGWRGRKTTRSWGNSRENRNKSKSKNTDTMFDVAYGPGTLSGLSPTT